MPLDIQMDGLTLSVANVKRSVKFYCETLGFTLVVDTAPDFAMVRPKAPHSPTIGLLSLEWAVEEKLKKVTPAMTEGMHLEFSTGDVDALYETLKKKGVTFDGPPEDRSWGERSTYGTDPDGYTIEFAQAEMPMRSKAKKKG